MVTNFTSIKMKKLLLIATLIAFVGCSDDDGDNNGCHCDAIFQLENSEQVFHTEENMEIDCETGEPTHNPTDDPEAVFVGCND